MPAGNAPRVAGLDIDDGGLRRKGGRGGERNVGGGKEDEEQN